MEDEFNIDVDQHGYPLFLKVIFTLIISVFIILNFIQINLIEMYQARSLIHFILDSIYGFLSIEEFLQSDIIILMMEFIDKSLTLILFVSYWILSYNLFKRHKNTDDTSLKLLHQGSSYKLKEGIKGILSFRRNGIPFYQPLILGIVLVEMIGSIIYEIIYYRYFTNYGPSYYDDLYLPVAFQIIITIMIISILKLNYHKISINSGLLPLITDYYLVFTPIIVFLSILIDAEAVWIMTILSAPVIISVILYLQYRVLRTPISFYIDDPESVSFYRFVKKSKEIELQNQS